MVESTQQTKTYDFIVIGAGSGGMGAGRRAAQFGKKVVMMENRVIGGTCVNVGCVPKKVMFNLANFIEELQVMKGYGVNGIEEIKVDFAHFKQQRDAYVLRLNGIYEKNLAKSEIDYVKGTCKFVSDKVVEVEGVRYTAEHIMIASGSTPAQEQFPGAEFCENSDDFFTWDTLPERAVVIGGGYIGIELAQILHALGVKVTLLVRSSMLRTFLDEDLHSVLLENMQKLGLDVRLKTSHDSVAKNPDGTLTVTTKTGETIVADKVLACIGRPPNITPLCLDQTGIKVEKNAVVVDEYQNTTVPGVYAIGDVTNQITLTPVAIRAGRIVSERIFNNRTGLKMDYNNVATVVFSHPPIGTVGLPEFEAKAKHGEENIQVFGSAFTNMFYSPATDPKHKLSSKFKVVCLKTGPDNGKDSRHLKVVGVHGIGKGIDEMMQGISIAVSMGATKQDFDNSVAIHPTASEEWVLLDGRFED